MKKVTLEANLEIINNNPVVTIKEKNGNVGPEVLISYLRKGISNNKIKVCTPKSEKGYTSYKFKVYNDNDKLNNYLVVKVKNSERYLHKQTLQTIKDIANISYLIKKVNINRFIAGIAVSAVILTVAGPTIAKELNNLNEKDYEHDQSTYKKYSVSDTINEEQKGLGKSEYYDNLREKILAGDKKAEEEYLNYVKMQHLEAQTEEELSKTR